MSPKTFLEQLSALDKAGIDAYLGEAQTNGFLPDLLTGFEKALRCYLKSELRVDKLSANARYLLISLLSRGDAQLVKNSAALGEYAKNRLTGLLKEGYASPVFIFKELVAALLDAGIYPDFNLTKDYALPGSARILLISTQHRSPEGIEKAGLQNRIPPLGIVRIATFLRALGVDADFFTVDRHAMPQLKARVAEKDYDLIGKSTLDPTFADDLDLIFRLNQDFPGKVYMLGGQGAVFDARERENIFTNTPVEVIGRGWGEFGLGAALLSLEHKPENPLEAFKRNTGFYVKSKDCPGGLDTGIKTDYALDDFRVISLIVDPRLFPEEHPRRTFVTSNYCPKGCVYCSCTNFLRPQPVLRLFPEDVVSYIKRTKRLCKNINLMSLFDDNFGGPYITRQGVRESGEEWIKKFSGLIKKERLDKIHYSIEISTDAINKEIVQALKSMGTAIFGFGIEGFSDSVLRAIRKGTSKEKNIRAIEESFNAGIITSVSLILFSPWETLDTLWETIDVASQLIIKSADFFLAVEIGMGIDPLRSSAIAGMKGIEFLTEEIKIHSYGEKLKSKVLPVDVKTKELYKKVIFEKDERIKRIKEKNELENKDKFLTHLAINFLNFQSEIEGPVDPLRKRIRQRLDGTDSFLSLVAFYGIYSLAAQLVDFTREPFSESDRAYFLQRQTILERYIHRYLFEGPFIKAVLESPNNLKKLKAKLKMAIHLYLLCNIPSVEGFLVSFGSLKKNGFSGLGNILKRNIKAAELYDIRADLEIIYFLTRAAEYYRCVNKHDTADRLSQRKNLLLTKEFTAFLQKSLLPMPELESLGPVYKEFIDETEELRRKVPEALL